MDGPLLPDHIRLRHLPPDQRLPSGRALGYVRGPRCYRNLGVLGGAPAGIRDHTRYPASDGRKTGLIVHRSIPGGARLEVSIRILRIMAPAAACPPSSALPCRDEPA